MTATQVFALIVAALIVALAFAGMLVTFPEREHFHSRRAHRRDVVLWVAACIVGVPSFLAICFPFFYFAWVA